LHGALLDSEILAEVYLELIGGRQQGLGLAGLDVGDTVLAAQAPRGPARPVRPHAASPEELAAHVAFVAKLKDPLWLKTE
jgi:DNA polymerase-3 subunit epsilon